MGLQSFLGWCWSQRAACSLPVLASVSVCSLWGGQGAFKSPSLASLWRLAQESTAHYPGLFPLLEWRAYNRKLYLE